MVAPVFDAADRWRSAAHKQKACAHLHAQYAASTTFIPLRLCDRYALTKTTGAAAVL
jgi:hypothetical protein